MNYALGNFFSMRLVLFRPWSLQLRSLNVTNASFKYKKKVTNEVSVGINSFQAWFNNSLEWWFPGETTIQSELTDIFGLTYIMSLPISPVAGAVVDFFAGRYRPSGQGLRFYLSRVA